MIDVHRAMNTFDYDENDECMRDLDVIAFFPFALLPLCSCCGSILVVTSSLPCLAMTSMLDVMYPGLTTTFDL